MKLDIDSKTCNHKYKNGNDAIVNIDRVHNICVLCEELFIKD